MVKLVAKSPAAGLVPVEAGGCRLTEIAPEAITWVSPFAGQSDTLSKALSDAVGVAMPGPNETQVSERARAIWVARDQALVMGPAFSFEGAAIADQSDAWTVLSLEGEGAIEVLARLTPVDLRAAVFPVNQTARTLIGHMTTSLTRTGESSWEIMVFRSMALTAVHELTRAMRGVEARAALA
ncbi:MAG: sarcosine oxidase subunit gamma family protein [Paracoccaceae bacterium]|nr:sarcosine oxidase subunit gamma family protein [Paracoccaceae bacterium]